MQAQWVARRMDGQRLGVILTTMSQEDYSTLCDMACMVLEARVSHRVVLGHVHQDHLIQRAGAQSLHQIADALNARGISSPRGGRWYAKSVSNVLERSA
jgi:hypothetical protein